MAKPIIPRSTKSPLDDLRPVQRARARAKRALRKVRDMLLDEFDAIPYNEYELNHLQTNAKRYDYLINVDTLEAILQRINDALGTEVEPTIWPEIEQAYEQGTSKTAENLSAMTEDYTRDIQSITLSQPYQSRVAIMRSRVFEEMEGFTGELGRELNRILTGAVQDGRSPLDVRKDIRKRFGVSMTRAERIARTEITGAQRRGRWDEAEYAQRNLGIRTKLMHLSAFLPTSRWTHMDRHGELFTIAEVREWYTVDGNAINCRCTQVEVLVDEFGQPKFPNVVEMAKENRVKFTRRIEEEKGRAA